MRSITVLIRGVGYTTSISVIKGFRQQDEFDTQMKLPRQTYFVNSLNDNNLAK